MVGLKSILSAMGKGRQTASVEERRSRRLIEIDIQLKLRENEAKRLEGKRERLIENSQKLAEASEQLSKLQQQLAAHISGDASLGQQKFKEVNAENDKVHALISRLKMEQILELRDLKDISEISAKITEINNEIKAMVDEAQQLLSEQLQEEGRIGRYTNIGVALERKNATQ